jgi:hypothetical protein
MAMQTKHTLALSQLFIFLFCVSLSLARNCNMSSVFEKVRTYFGAQSESIPMSFVLGFYVSLVVKRWWEQYKLLPWPDTLALFISAAIPGNVRTHEILSCRFISKINVTKTVPRTAAGAWSTDETKHYEVYGASVCDNSTANFIESEKTISRTAASRRLGSDAREREENFRNHGLEKSHVQVRASC